MLSRQRVRIIGGIVLCSALVGLSCIAWHWCRWSGPQARLLAQIQSDNSNGTYPLPPPETGGGERQNGNSNPHPWPLSQRKRGERQPSPPAHARVSGKAKRSASGENELRPSKGAWATPPRPGPARLLFVGDVLPLQDRDYLDNVKQFITGADLAVCNLECVLSTHGTKSPLKLRNGRSIHNEFFFRVAPAHGQRLAAAGFDVVTLANNHSMDYGGEALLETLAVLDAAGIKASGAGRDATAARRPAICEAQGQTVAVLAYVSPKTLPGTEHFAATEHTAGTVFVQPGPNSKPTAHTCAMVRNDISAARKQADFVVVCYHWGREARREPEGFAKHLAHLSVDCGADLVIGHHPHTPQGIEIYKGRPIAYSLGNFAFSTRWRGLLESIMLEVLIRDGKWQKIVAHPVTLQHLLGDPSPATGETGRSIARRIAELSAAWKTPCSYVRDDQTTALMINNPAAEKGARDRLLEAEAKYFYTEMHPQITGMATVHFLAWDVEGQEKSPKVREIVVAKALAGEVLEIFKQIYFDAEQFPIHDLVGYNYRTAIGGRGLSKHAVGRAIDINRAENPMIKGGKKLVHPDEPPYTPGEWRPGEDPYSIAPAGSVVRIFKAHGWRWGGEWTSCKDYQHFDR